MSDHRLPRPAVLLGLSGILPQLLFLALALVRPEWREAAMTAGAFYAAIILSFLGGMWWMQALVRRTAGTAPYVVAVVPSLAALAALLPGSVGQEWGQGWPGASLLLLAALLAASPAVDRWLARRFETDRRHETPAAWLRLRVAMASGLGLATALLALA